MNLLSLDRFRTYLLNNTPTISEKTSERCNAERYARTEIGAFLSEMIALEGKNVFYEAPLFVDILRIKILRDFEPEKVPSHINSQLAITAAVDILKRLEGRARC